MKQDGKNGKNGKPTRMTTDFSSDSYQVLENVAIRLDTSKASALRKGVTLLDVLLQHKAEGWKFFLEKADERKEILTL